MKIITVQYFDKPRIDALFSIYNFWSLTAVFLCVMGKDLEHSLYGLHCGQQMLADRYQVCCAKKWSLRGFFSKYVKIKFIIDMTESQF